MYVFAGWQGIGGRLNVAAREQAATVVFQAEGSLGFALAIGSYNIPGNTDTVADLAVGIPGPGRSQPIWRRTWRGSRVFWRLNAVTRLDATALCLAPPPAPEQSSLANPDLEYGANLGFALAYGDLNGEGAGNVVTTAPFADAPGRSQAGLVGTHFGMIVPLSRSRSLPTPSHRRIKARTSRHNSRLRAGRRSIGQSAQDHFFRG